MFLAIKFAGAAYLVYLGAQALIAALRPGRTESISASGGAPRRLAPWAAFRQGLISDLGNPKMAVFFASVLPQFAQPSEGMFSALVFLGFAFSALTFAWLALYAIAVATLGSLLRRPGMWRKIEAVSGAVLIALGLRLATEQLKR